MSQTQDLGDQGVSDAAPAPRRAASVALDRITAKLWRHGASLPADLAFHVTNTGLFDTRRRRAASPPLRAPQPHTTALAAEIASSGRAITSTAALAIPGTDGMLAAADQVVAGLRAQRRRMGAARPATVVSGLADILGAPALYRWGLSDGLLDIVEAYLGGPAGYDGCIAMHDLADGAETGARWWHRDREDLRMVKLALYLNDIGPEDGPLELALTPPPRRVSYEVFRDRDFATRFPDARRNACIGPAGTLVFADTAAHFHRGRPPTGRERAVVYFNYFPRNPRHPFYCDRTRVSRPMIQSLCAALGPRQRAAALWRDGVPALLKLVPRSLA